MKALVYYGPRDIRISEIEKPKINKNEVLVKVEACGICGSDVHGYLGITGRRIPPMVMGHEFTGIVEALGGDIEDISIGDRVVVYPARFCGRCEFCKVGLTNLCINRTVFGVMSVNGAMAEYVAVPRENILKLPDNIDFIKGTFLEPLSVAYRAVKTAGDILNKNILIVGAGTIGLLILQVVRFGGARNIVISDVNDRRLEIARKLGADITLNPEKEDVKVSVSHNIPDGIDVAFEAVGLEVTVNQALNILKNRGTCVFVGNAMKNITIDMQNIVTRELRILGTYTFTVEEFKESINLLEKINTKEMLSKIVPLEEGPEAFEELAKKDSNILKVVLRV
ncbi:MAG: galactitol-1-phosphate 5-dehydrogenase [bacterium]|nr:galactitol-1-phosphate 5-dehydrogenase [bacterium]